MQTHHLSTRWALSGYGTALVAFFISALFLVDVFGEWLVNTSYLFAIGYWYEVTVATAAAVAGAILAAVTYLWRR